MTTLVGMLTQMQEISQVPRWTYRPLMGVEGKNQSSQETVALRGYLIPNDQSYINIYVQN